MTRSNAITAAMLAWLVVFSVCPSSGHALESARGGPHTNAPACEPTSGRLDAQATLAGREGGYLLTLVRLVDVAETRRVRGALILRRQPCRLARLQSASTPLYGFTDIDLRAVGAHRVGDSAATDPEAPGVLVLESVRDGERRILLRLGSAANRRDSALFDGAYTVLDVRRIHGDGFAGIWRSSGRLSRTGGYFCARRADK